LDWSCGFTTQIPEIDFVAIFGNPTIDRRENHIPYEIRELYCPIECAE
jgi:hypothetical protein